MTVARWLLAAVIVFAANSAAHAATPDDAGWYVGASAGRSSFDFPDGGGVDESAFAIHAGYRLNRYFAIEAGYADQGSDAYRIECSIFVTPLPGACPVAVDQSFSRADLALVAILPLGGHFDLFAKAGQAQTRFVQSFNAAHAANAGHALLQKGSTTSAESLYGIGARWHFSAHWSMRLQWDRTDLGFMDKGDAMYDNLEVDSYWLGVEYRAGGRARGEPVAGTGSGWYLGGSLGRFTGNDFLWGAHDFDAFAVHGGYRLGRYLAVEAGYADLGDSTQVYNCQAGVGCDPFIWPRTLSQSIQRVDVSLLGILPLGERFELFAKLGQARMQHDQTFETPPRTSTYFQTHSGTLYGAGGRWHFKPGWSLRVQWDRTDTEYYEQDLDGYWLGIEHRFGR